ncbi:ABC transporter ATP-binding protein [Nocardioides sp. SR21]|uniref:ABC transporter ATP-binding protein n=1 Tax=Nocardioides sp. SR21 TaxID=2919501 RepID=UPI001FAAB2F5|nr:ABC transporter ATP-binding protein [Nocardioides sp. SR21]
MARRIWALLRPSRGRLVAVAFLLVLTTAATLAGPWILRYAIDHGLTGTSPDLDVVTRASLLFLGIGVTALVLVRVQTRLVARIGERFVRDLRESVFSHILSMPPRFFERTAAGQLVTRMTSDIDALQLLVEMGMVQLVQALLTLFLLAVALTVLSWKLTLACLLVAPLVAIATVWFRRNSQRAYLGLRDRVSETVETLVEGVGGVREIQATGQQDRMLAAFSERNDRQYDANVRSVWVQALYLPVMELLPIVSSCIALGLGGWLVIEGEMTVGTLSAFLLYLQLTFEPIQSLSFLFNQVQSAGAALRKIFGLLDTPSDLPSGTATLPAGGDVELRGVSFRYDREAPYVLSGVDLVIPRGEHLALVGATGAGKSTLAKLVARFYDPAAGRILLGGTDLRDADLAGLRRRIAMITQDGYLFDGSVRDNIRVARPDATDADVEAAVALIGATEALTPLLDSLAGQGGSQLSAGQRQLVALARAALLEAEVLILDEATSDLDPGTELAVTTAMTEVMRGRTVLVIAHRLSTILESDRIAVVADGGIAELGTHDELVARGGRYAALYASWPGGDVIRT